MVNIKQLKKGNIVPLGTSLGNRYGLYYIDQHKPDAWTVINVNSKSKSTMTDIAFSAAVASGVEAFLSKHKQRDDFMLNDIKNLKLGKTLPIYKKTVLNHYNASLKPLHNASAVKLLNLVKIYGNGEYTQSMIDDSANIDAELLGLYLLPLSKYFKITNKISLAKNYAVENTMVPNNAINEMSTSTKVINFNVINKRFLHWTCEFTALALHLDVKVDMLASGELYANLHHIVPSKHGDTEVILIETHTKIQLAEAKAYNEFTLTQANLQRLYQTYFGMHINTIITSLVKYSKALTFDARLHSPNRRVIYAEKIQQFTNTVEKTLNKELPYIVKATVRDVRAQNDKAQSASKFQPSDIKSSSNLMKFSAAKQNITNALKDISEQLSIRNWEVVHFENKFGVIVEYTHDDRTQSKHWIFENAERKSIYENIKNDTLLANDSKLYSKESMMSFTDVKSKLIKTLRK